MRSLFTFLLAVLYAGCASSVPTPTPFDGKRALSLVEAQLAFGPRTPGSPAHAATAAWILNELEEAGWTRETQEFEYAGLGLRNLIGRSSSGAGEDIVILGAHYDTRPHADQDPIDPRAPVPGANDGASGVAVLLELARAMPPDSLPQPVWLVFFDGEDSGRIDGWDWIVGSMHFAATLQIEPAAVIVVDMVGDAQLELYYERNSDQALSKEIWAVAQQLGYRAFVPEYRYSMIDDHTPFLRLGLPAIDIIDFDYPYWHTTQDTLDKVSAESLEQVGRTLQTWLTTAP